MVFLLFEHLLPSDIICYLIISPMLMKFMERVSVFFIASFPESRHTHVSVLIFLTIHIFKSIDLSFVKN